MWKWPTDKHFLKNNHVSLSRPRSCGTWQSWYFPGLPKTVPPPLIVELFLTKSWLVNVILCRVVLEGERVSKMASLTQRPNVYNSRLRDPRGHQEDSLRYLAEVIIYQNWQTLLTQFLSVQVKTGLAKAILEQDITKATVWVINLHKFIILYGLNFSRADHVYFIKVS